MSGDQVCRFEGIDETPAVFVVGSGVATIVRGVDEEAFEGGGTEGAV